MYSIDALPLNGRGKRSWDPARTHGMREMGRACRCGKRRANHDFVFLCLRKGDWQRPARASPASALTASALSGGGVVHAGDDDATAGVIGAEVAQALVLQGVFMFALQFKWKRLDG